MSEIIVPSLDHLTSKSFFISPAMEPKAVIPSDEQPNVDLENLPSRSEDDQLQLILKKSLFNETEKKKNLRKLISEKINDLNEELQNNPITAVRNVKGDGNCLYRALMISYLEHIAVNDSDKFDDLIKIYEKSHAEITGNIQNLDGDILDSTDFARYIKVIKNEDNLGKRIQLLVKAFNIVDFDRSLVALTRYEIFNRIEFQLDDDEKIKTMGEYAEDLRPLQAFANAFDVNVFCNSLTTNNLENGLTFISKNKEDESPQIAVLHRTEPDHYYAARLKSVQDQIPEDAPETVKRLSKNENDLYSFDKNEITQREDGFLPLNKKGVKINLWENKEAFEIFITDIFPKETTVTVTESENAKSFQATSDKTDNKILYNKETQTITTEGNDALALLFAVMKKHAKEHPDNVSTWKLDGVDTSKEALEGYRRTYLSDLSLELQNKINLVGEEPKFQASAKLVNSKPDTSRLDAVKNAFNDESVFKSKVLKNAWFNKSTGLNDFVTQYAKEINEYLEKKIEASLNDDSNQSSLAPHIEPYVRQMFEIALSHVTLAESDPYSDPYKELALQLTNNIKPQEKAQALRHVLEHKTLDKELKNKLANCLLSEIDVEKAASGNLWGINTELRNLLDLVEAGSPNLIEFLGNTSIGNTPFNALLKKAIEKNDSALITVLLNNKPPHKISDENANSLVSFGNFNSDVLHEIVKYCLKEPRNLDLLKKLSELNYPVDFGINSSDYQDLFPQHDEENDNRLEQPFLEGYRLLSDENEEAIRVAVAPNNLSKREIQIRACQYLLALNAARPNSENHDNLMYASFFMQAAAEYIREIASRRFNKPAEKSDNGGNTRYDNLSQLFSLTINAAKDNEWSKYLNTVDEEVIKKSGSGSLRKKFDKISLPEEKKEEVKQLAAHL